MPVDAVSDALATARVQVVLVDLQDVGCRCYTFPATLRDVVWAAGAAGARVVVLDRPNPLGGAVAAGPVLDPAFSSFVGVAPVRLRHGLTLGELAGLLAEDVAVEVVAADGWRRTDPWERTGVPWVPPSPNLPTVEAVTCYPGSVLVEGTTLSEGRGTATPFTFIGAPWVDGRLAATLRAWDLPGVLIRDTSATPTASKHVGERCRGVALHVRDAALFDPVATAVAVLGTAHRLYPDDFAWVGTPDDEGRLFVDKLSGSAALRKAVDAREDPRDLAARFSAPGPATGPRTYDEGTVTC